MLPVLKELALARISISLCEDAFCFVIEGRSLRRMDEAGIHNRSSN